MPLQRIRLSAPDLRSTRQVAAPRPRPMTTKRRILVVDDEPDVVDSVAATIRAMPGFDLDVTTTTSSLHAVELIRQRTFDLVLSDFRMPGPNGIDVLAAARAKDPRTHRVLMTSYADVVADTDRIRAAEVDAYVQKPFAMEDLELLAQGFLGESFTLMDAFRMHARRLEKEAAGV